MARDTGAKCRQCRREGMKLFLKGERCNSDRCSFERRAYAPGIHGQRHRKLSDYGFQLREKQKVKRIYGIVEKQFRLYFHEADRMKGVTGENLLSLLERRLDNVVYRLGFAVSRAEARQLIRHGHFRLNQKKATIPSIILRPGDEVSVKEKSTKMDKLQRSIMPQNQRQVPAWLEVERDAFKGKVVATPNRDEITLPIQEQLIVELYSK